MASSLPPRSKRSELSVFTDQAYNLILLAEDEARMLGRLAVEPEHVLLALSRTNNVKDLLAERGVAATDIYNAIVRVAGIGSDLIVGFVPWSLATRESLGRAIEAAARRGVVEPTSEHVLLGVAANANVTQLLGGLGIADIEQLVDRRYPVQREPLTVADVKRHASRVGAARTPPSPGPIPPVFERYTPTARAAIVAAEQHAVALGHQYVEPFHLLLGLLATQESVASKILRHHGIELNDAIERLQLLSSAPMHRRESIFSDVARRIVAQDALSQAHRHGHTSIGTGHVLLAILDVNGETIRVLGTQLAGDRISAAIRKELPGNEGI